MPRALEQLTLAISGFGAGAGTRRILEDWFEFLGGRPAEVVYVDGGSPRSATRVLAGLVDAGLIDRLELLNPRHWENHPQRCYIQEHRSALLATRPLVAFVKLDVLPYRRGLDGWLDEDAAMLDRPEVFAITFSHLIDPPTGREGPYLSFDFASLNFSVMKRDRAVGALEEQMGAFAAGGYRGEYPAHIRCEPEYRRALVEWCWQEHCRAHGLRTIARSESRDWTILHINKSGRRLRWIRERYRSRVDIERYFDVSKALYRPPPPAWKRAGKSVENALRRWRSGRDSGAG